MTNQQELRAIVAHGLLNSLAVLHGAAGSLIQYGEKLSTDDRDMLLAAIESQGETFADGLEIILEECSRAFADAASTVVLLSRAVRHARGDDLGSILDGVITRTAVLRTGLEAQVRALPAEVLELLESLQR